VPAVSIATGLLLAVGAGQGAVARERLARLPRREDRLAALGFAAVQTLIEQPQARVVEGSNGLLLEIDGQIVPNYDATLKPFEEGEVVTGHVVRIDRDEVLVDIGYKSEGVIPANELSIRKSVDPHEEVRLGEEVDALVLTKEDQDGRLIVSKKRARFEKAWRRIETAAESGEPVQGTVIEVVKGGLIIDLGVRGFLPASLVDIRRVPNLDEYMGTQIETKVIELNRSRNNVVLSRRAVLEEERKEVRQQILDRLQPGLVVEGQISNIVDFGAFVDLDGIDGLIHISELSWSHVNHPSEILNIGDTVQVKVLDIDRERQRISLGLKQTQEDPWQRIVDTYNINDELEGKVTKVVTFGAFVEILDGVEGLVHISELAPHHVESPREIVHPGDEIRVRILEIDSERRRLSLSAKRVEDQLLPLSRPGEPAAGVAADEASTVEGVLDSDAPIAAEVEASTAADAPAAPEAETPAPLESEASVPVQSGTIGDEGTAAPEAVESEAVEAEGVEAEGVEAEVAIAPEPEAVESKVAVAPEPETVLPDQDAEPADPEPEAAGEPEPVAPEAEPVASERAVSEPEVSESEPEAEPVASELEAAASEPEASATPPPEFETEAGEAPSEDTLAVEQSSALQD
jgi:small subunit ribosomal protein S1